MGINSSIDRRLMQREDYPPVLRFFAVVFVVLVFLWAMFGPAVAQEYGHADDNRERVWAQGSRIGAIKRHAPARPARRPAAVAYLPHPPGCPASLFCGCGASVDVFGRPIRSLWPSTAWFKFPRTTPAVNTVAVRRGHVFVLKQHVQGKIWMVNDYNSGGRKSRYHARSIAGYVIVAPRAAYAMVRE